MRKADPSSRRSPRRRPLPDVASEAHPRTVRKPLPAEAHDADFGLALALGPAMRRRPDA